MHSMSQPLKCLLRQVGPYEAPYGRDTVFCLNQTLKGSLNCSADDTTHALNLGTVFVTGPPRSIKSKASSDNILLGPNDYRT
jgi:hypothetical protein